MIFFFSISVFSVIDSVLPGVYAVINTIPWFTQISHFSQFVQVNVLIQNKCEVTFMGFFVFVLVFFSIVPAVLF